MPISVQPRGITLEDWAAQLRIDLSEDVPIYYGGGNWKDWATRCMALDTFQKNGVPAPDPFKTWQEWADRVFQTLS